mmetsp:Transcript_2092/g.4536  ORF Transcript_2092/g.4536 Transcript_2092/m.4536 type:complete len:232 (-) Transcript_2092:118-813(-)|eukprot:CAMPEP_0171340316 /NCGR_PEP_ID=MMETSP0878-20121228/8494_1 /TAXON_ID=67004 /ORGANISM="Thalassiosira weissflogii, Strain CCMP1336" /LENGTH=231 /DNA_ID=CAMNT_0011842367 /DNA_START=83 /DNA_END=778 /DNA_ORIENTATION=+
MATFLSSLPLIQLLVILGCATAFSASSPQSAPWQNFLSSIISTSSTNNSNSFPNPFATDTKQRRRQDLKQQLLNECQQNLGVNSPQVRLRIEALIGELRDLNPTSETALSPLLRKIWVLEWTSEKEINFFLEKGISDRITQTLSFDNILENNIPFVKGGSFGVSGNISPDLNKDDYLRTNFKFINAKLDLGWINFNFPPIGEGWFDTVYLDDELRIDTNSRDDILICTAEK